MQSSATNNTSEPHQNISTKPPQDNLKLHYTLGPMTPLLLRSIALFSDYREFFVLAFTSKLNFRTLLNNERFLAKYLTTTLGIISNFNQDLNLINSSLASQAIQEIQTIYNAGFKPIYNSFKKVPNPPEFLNSLNQRAQQLVQYQDQEEQQSKFISKNSSPLDLMISNLVEFVRKKKKDPSGSHHSLLLGYQVLGDLRKYWDFRYVFTTVGRFVFNAASESKNILPLLSAVWVDFNLFDFTDKYIISTTLDTVNDLSVDMIQIERQIQRIYIMVQEDEKAQQEEVFMEYIKNHKKWNKIFERMINTVQKEVDSKQKTLRQAINSFRCELYKFKLFFDGFGISSCHKSVAVAPIMLSAMMSYLVIQEFSLRQFVKINHPRSFVIIASNRHSQEIEDPDYLSILANINTVAEIENLVNSHYNNILPPISRIQRRKNVNIVHFLQNYYQEKRQQNGRILFWICFDSCVKKESMDNDQEMELVIRLQKRVACRILSVKSLSFLKDFDEVQLRKIIVKGWPIKNSQLGEIDKFMKDNLFQS